jgi:hypothetical protein
MTQETVDKLELYNIKSTAAGHDCYNKRLTYIKQITNDCIFERKLKELVIEGCYYSAEEYVNNNYHLRGLSNFTACSASKYSID